jgi:hypothetical protein
MESARDFKQNNALKLEYVAGQRRIIDFIAMFKSPEGKGVERKKGSGPRRPFGNGENMSGGGLQLPESFRNVEAADCSNVNQRKG